MVARIVLAVVVAVATTLACMLVGALLGSVGLPVAVAVGGFLSTWGTVIGLLAGLWYFFKGGFAVPSP